MNTAAKNRVAIPLCQKKEITVVIPSSKNHIYTLKKNRWLHEFKVVVLKNNLGLSKAYNECFRQAKTDIIVLLNDDLLIDSQILHYFSVVDGEFAMLQTSDFPISGITIIRRRDFWLVGGFNESLKYGSVDREFFCRATLKGLKYKPIPLSLAKHFTHTTRYSTIYKSFHSIRDNVICIKKYFIYFPQLFFKHDFLNRVWRKQFKSILLHIFFFFKITLFDKLKMLKKYNSRPRPRLKV